VETLLINNQQRVFGLLVLLGRRAVQAYDKKANHAREGDTGKKAKGRKVEMQSEPALLV
jgi:hypothetical protein